jgi:hypothetical protein
VTIMVQDELAPAGGIPGAGFDELRLAAAVVAPTDSNPCLRSATRFRN